MPSADQIAELARLLDSGEKVMLFGPGSAEAHYEVMALAGRQGADPVQHPWDVALLGYGAFSYWPLAQTSKRPQP